MNDLLNKLIITASYSVKDAMRKMDESAEKILFVVDQSSKRLIGAISDGDIRRFILKDGSINETIEYCYNKKPHFLIKGESEAKAKEIMIKYKIEAIPIVDNEMQLEDVIIWSELFNGNSKPKDKAYCPVVIMAGGKGERLDPFTKIFPKSLIPIGDKPILKVLLDKFDQYGMNEFYLTLNYMGDMVKSYLDTINIKYNIKYIWEKEFLGTAGSLIFLPDDLATNFIVTNCDVVVDANYADLLKFHENNENDLTIVGALQHHVLSYGVIEYMTDGVVKKITEKPEYDFTVNTGVYVMNKKVLNYIPKNEVFHVTDLIGRLLEDNKKVGVYPISEKSYMDVGQWAEYRKNAEKIFKLEP